jgi:hypothetical protein
MAKQFSRDLRAEAPGARDQMEPVDRKGRRASSRSWSPSEAKKPRASRARLAAFRAEAKAAAQGMLTDNTGGTGKSYSAQCADEIAIEFSALNKTISTLRAVVSETKSCPAAGNIDSIVALRGRGGPIGGHGMQCWECPWAEVHPFARPQIRS